VAVAKRVGTGLSRWGWRGATIRMMWMRMRARAENGACMAAASCGDGFVEAGVEGCDDAEWGGSG
jgi:hypothetical protein